MDDGIGGTGAVHDAARLGLVLRRFGYDDALDTFGVHAVGGTLGSFLTGIFATEEVNGNLSTNLSQVLSKNLLWVEQLKAMGLTILMSVLGTAVIAWIIKGTLGLRASEEAERQGLDLASHGEEGYIL